MTLKRPILAAVIAAILFVIFVWDTRQHERSILQQLQDQRVLFQDPTEATVLVFENEKGRVELHRESTPGSPWHIVFPRELPADQTSIATFLENLRGAKRHAEFIPENLAEYGLAAPPMKVTITVGKDAPRTLEFGAPPVNFGRAYAHVAGDKTIFTISEWLYRQAGKDVASLREKGIGTKDIARAKKLTVENRRTSFSVERANDTTTSWTLFLKESIHPIPADRSIIDRLLQNIAEGNMLTVVDSSTSTTAQLGLDKPTARLLADGTPIITIGAPVPGKEQFYVQTKDGTLGVAPATLFADFFRSGTEWGTKQFIWLPRNEIALVNTSVGKMQTHLLLKDDEWIIADMPGVRVRQEKVLTFLNSLSTFLAFRLIKPSVTEEQLLEYGFVADGYSLEATATDGRTQGFRFGRTDTKEGTTFVLRTQDMSLWSVPLVDQHEVYGVRRDFEDRRIVFDAPTRTQRIEMEGGDKAAGLVVTFEKTTSAWKAYFPNSNPTTVVNARVDAFLQSLDELSSDAESPAAQHVKGVMAFRFYEQAKGGKPYAEFHVITADKKLEVVYLDMDGKMVEVPLDKFSNFEEYMTQLLLAGKANAEEDAKK